VNIGLLVAAARRGSFPPARQRHHVVGIHEHPPVIERDRSPVLSRAVTRLARGRAIHRQVGGAPMLGRSPATARQLASRARRRVRGAEVQAPDPDTGRQREVVDAFYAAARRGDLGALVAVLDPDVVMRSDGGTARPDASVVVRGAAAVAGQALRFHQPSALVRPALVNGAAGVVVTMDGQPIAVIGFTVSRGKIVEIGAIAETERLLRLDLAVLDD
jgi:ketosteroid isomerase-like protein